MIGEKCEMREAVYWGVGIGNRSVTLAYGRGMLFYWNVLSFFMFNGIDDIGIGNGFVTLPAVNFRKLGETKR